MTNSTSLTNQTMEINHRSEVSLVVDQLQECLGARTLVLLIGEVGAGKTTTLSELCQRLHMSEVASPSFAIHHRYENAQGKSLDHVDLYRIKDEDDLESTGFWDLLSQPTGWVFVEWADRVDAEAWPIYWPTWCVRWEKLEGEKRRVIFEKLR